MHKKSIGPRVFLASVLAVAMCSSYAQSNVTVYGVADLGVSIANTGNGRLVSMASGMEDGSRIGFKGTEDLGGGYKTMFILEARVEFDTGEQSTPYASSGVNQTLLQGLPAPVANALTPAIAVPKKIVNSSNALFDRQSLVGLITPAGAILLGRQYTPAYEVANSADVFESGAAGTWAHLTYINGNALTAGLALRWNGAAQYRIQTPGGVIFSLMAAPGGGTGSVNLSKQAWATNLMYRANGIDAGIGFNSEQDQNGKQSLQTLVIGGSYASGDFKYFGGYAKSKNDNPAVIGLISPSVGPTYASIVGENAKVDSHVLTAGVQYTVGSGKIKAGGSRLFNHRAPDANATLLAVAYDYYLSKRTILYSAYAHVANERKSQVSAGGAGYLGGATHYQGADGRIVQLGIRHLF